MTVFAGANTRPIAVAPSPVLPKAPPAKTPATDSSRDIIPDSEDVAAVLAWIDGLGVSGLDGHGLGELGLRNGNLTVDDQRSGKRWSFTHINVSLSRADLGGVLFRLASDNQERPWQLSAAVRPLEDGVRAVGIEARQVSLNDLLLAARLGDGTIESNLPLSASLRADFASDGSVKQARGQILASGGEIHDTRDPSSKVTVEHADIRFTWDGAHAVFRSAHGSSARR